MQGRGFTCCPWIGRTYITVQWSMLQYSDWIFNSRIFLLIYSSVGYRNLSHQVIEDSSQHNHFNNSYGAVVYHKFFAVLIVFPSHSILFGIFVLIHLTWVSNLFTSIGGGAMKTFIRLTIFIGHCLVECSFSMQLCRIFLFLIRVPPPDRRPGKFCISMSQIPRPVDRGSRPFFKTNQW